MTPPVLVEDAFGKTSSQTELNIVIATASTIAVTGALLQCQLRRLVHSVQVVGIVAYKSACC